MSDETEGWVKKDEDYYEKETEGDGYWYAHRLQNNIWQLRISGQHAAYRPTLRECQQLAHATARLWAGEKE